MIVYRVQRAVELKLRSVQVGLLRATDRVSAAANRAGDLAKIAAQASADRQIMKGYREVDAAYDVADRAMNAANDIADAFEEALPSNLFLAIALNAGVIPRPTTDKEVTQ